MCLFKVFEISFDFLPSYSHRGKLKNRINLPALCLGGCGKGPGLHEGLFEIGRGLGVGIKGSSLVSCQKGIFDGLVLMLTPAVMVGQDSRSLL